MSEWWTYRLSDFLLFSPRTYYRLFELYNEAIWPGHLVALAVGLAIAVMLRKPGPLRSRIVAALLAACWLWVAWAYLFTRYATINWAAPWLAAAFAIEASLLALVAVVAGGLSPRPGARPAPRIGFGLFLFALAVQPLIGPLLGRPWSQIELFGLAPDPTAVGTMGVLLTAAGRRRWLLLPIPLAWCALTGATLWTMGAPDAWVTPLAGALALGAGLVPSRRPSST